MTDQGLAVSAIVPARNEEPFIEACVRSLLGQDSPAGGFEVIVAEGRSDDGTRSILDRLAKEDARLRVIDNPERITPAAFNAGIRQARGRFIALISAHSRYPNDYLVRCLEIAEQTGADNVGGPAVAQASGYLPRAIALAHHSPFSVGGASWHSLEYEGPAGTVFGGFYRRDVFSRIGMFDEELVRNQDDELNFRLERAGGRIWQSPKVRSWYTPRSTLGALFRQYQQYGYFKVRVMLKHGGTPALRHYVPAAFVAGLGGWIASVVVAAVSGGRNGALVRAAELLTLVPLSYTAVLVIASVTTAARSGWSLLPILPVVFATYHVAYGVGFLRGLFDFVLRRHRSPARRMSELTR